ncbi:hypothetical protein PV10_03634 [Exophiala mesophila]|uniref:Metallo-beta-lactamase domain-containing protein n=1 Tax=Exophiala mesophila TaxID=212818 RepID=A0A0D1ZN83_EXOME|nr:uncharacterized protein PV10_03634 [Exophiala mesophila]KIV96052.1 hypothetical protein PV10_03634 [Exophiala mesophila]
MSNDDDGKQPGDQLQCELKASIRRAHQAKKPFITHLNADTTWLLSLPYPEPSLSPRGRSRYNILIDPWLKGTQEDVAGWFSKQWHSVKSSVESATELDDLLRQAERLEQCDSDCYVGDDDRIPSMNIACNRVDGILISHEFTDHCHRATLLDFDADIPVYASTKAAQLIRSWKHFNRVVQIPPFDEKHGWSSHGHGDWPWPSWVNISRITTRFDALAYHSAMVICVRPRAHRDTTDAYIYSPHGIEASSVSKLMHTRPPLNVVAFLHGLHDVSIANHKQLNLGAVNAIKAQRTILAKYWIGTHDEEKPGSGLIAPLLQRKVWSVVDALASIRHSESDMGREAWLQRMECVELANGESFLLE